MDQYVRIYTYMRTSFWWWLFSTNIECNPTILKMVDDEMILWTFTRFPLAFIRFRFYFTAFWQANLRFSGDSVKCVPFACIPKNDTLFFEKLDKLLLFFFGEDYHCRSLHIGSSWGRGEKFKNVSKILHILHTKSASFLLISNCGVYPYHWHWLDDEKRKSFHIFVF